jgi:hypothetical protein
MPEYKRSLEKPRRRWECNINMDLREIGIYSSTWIWVILDRVGTVMKLQVP